MNESALGAFIYDKSIYYTLDHHGKTSSFYNQKKVKKMFLQFKSADSIGETICFWLFKLVSNASISL